MKENASMLHLLLTSRVVSSTNLQNVLILSADGIINFLEMYVDKDK